jgi:hypothetical protein
VLGLGGYAGRKAKTGKKHDLPITQQAKALKLSRGATVIILFTRRKTVS